MIEGYPRGRGLGWIGALAVAAAALAGGAGKPKPALDAAEYRATMAEEAREVAVLQERFEAQRRISLPLLPPGPEISIALPLVGRVVPFEWKRFPKEFVAGLEGRWENSVPVYDLTLAEDPLTHETLFCNAAGEPILRLPGLAWSDPADLSSALAAIYGVVPGTAGAALLDARLWNPARLRARLTLIRSEDVEYYLYAEARVRDCAASLQPAPAPPVTMRMGGSDGIYFSAVQWAPDGIEMNVALPAAFTNRVDLFASTNLVEFEWSVLAGTLSTTGGSPLVWTDMPPPETPRFYAAGDADTDSDRDGLADAREFFVHHTSPTDPDTDGDGMPDGWEAGYGFNPAFFGATEILSDSDGDGFPAGEEFARGTSPTNAQMNSATGTVGAVRYYFDVDDRLLNAFYGAQGATGGALTPGDNLSAQRSAGRSGP